LTALHERATVTIPEFARRFGIARSTAYALAQQDALPVPVIRLGRRMVVSRDLLERVLAGEAVRISRCEG
jgi:predicted DNA-binding transcriptional regulator AlpA